MRELIQKTIDSIKEYFPELSENPEAIQYEWIENLTAALELSK